MPRKKNQEQEMVELIPEGHLEILNFKGRECRRVMHNNEWYYSVVDVIEAMTDSERPRKYWNDLKTKLVHEEGFKQLSENIGQLKMPSSDGKLYATDAANVETLLRIVQSIPSPKAELIKRWLARTGYERIQESQNPDIAIKRAITDYKLKGYSDEWIEARIGGKLTRVELTSEWAKRGIKGQEYATLTNAVHEGTFEISVKQHEEYKQLTRRGQLREHMTSTELLFTRLGEVSAKNISVARNAQGLADNQIAANDGGQIAGNARRALDRQTGGRVVSPSNHLPEPKASHQLPDVE